MKKLMILLAALIMAVSCNSGITYNVDINGDANGNVLVEFPDGKLNLNGDADLAFKYGNDTLSVDEFYTEQQLLFGEVNGAAKALEAMESFDDQFNATALSGDYYVHIEGFAKEPKSGLVIKIDKTFTNRADSTVKTPVDSLINVTDSLCVTK